MKTWYEKNKERHKLNRRLYYQKNKDRERAKIKAWKEDNPDAQRKYSKKYQKTHREKINDLGRKHNSIYRQNNREKERLRAKKYRQQNPNIIRAQTAKRRCVKLRQTPKWADLKAIREFYKNCPEGYHVDHIVPLRGKNVSGLHTLENLQYLPAVENRKKYNKFS